MTMIHNSVVTAAGVGPGDSLPGYVRLFERGVLGVGGSDAREFLQNLVSNDVRRLDPTHALYALLLTAQGKCLFDFFLADAPGADAATPILIDVEAARLPDLLRRLTLYRLHAAVTLTDLSARFAVAAVFGGDATQRLGLHGGDGAAAAFGDGIAFVDPRLAELGARVIAPAAAIDAALQGAGLTAKSAETYNAARIALGVPDGSHDLLVDKTLPLEAGLDELHAIDYGKGCYVGQELTARTHYRGTIRKRLFRVDVDGPLPAPGTEVTFAGIASGDMRSGTGTSGLAMLRLEHVDEAARSGTPFHAGASTLRAVRPAWFAPPAAAATHPSA